MRTLPATILLISFCACIVSADPGSDNRASAAPETQVDLAGFGIHFAAPQGWKRLPELHYSQLARFARVENGKLVGLLEIDAAPTKGRTVKEIAAKIVADRGGEIVTEKPSGGMIELRLTPKKQFSSQVAAITPVRDMVILISSGGDEKAAWEALRAVTASVALSEPKPADEDLSLRKQSFPLFDSPVLISLPEAFRPNKVEQPKLEAFYGARDWPSGRDDASVQIQVMPNSNSARIEETTETLAEDLSAKLKLPQAIHFKKMNDAPSTYISTPFSPRPKEAQRIVYTVLDNSHFALLIFRSTAPEAAARERYMTMARQVSIEMRVAN